MNNPPNKIPTAPAHGGLDRVWTDYSRCLVGLQLQPKSSPAADTRRDFVLDTLKSTYGVKHVATW